MSWLLQGLLTNWLAAVLVFVGGAAVGFLKHKGSRWAGPALYAFGGSALIASIIAAFAILSMLPDRVTPGNAQSHVRDWLDHWTFEVSKVSDADTIFTFKARFSDGHPVFVKQLKSNDQSLLLQAIITTTPEEQTTIRSLPRDMRDEFQTQLTQEAARANVIFSNVKDPFDNVVIEKRLGIGPGLNEYVFLDKMNEMDFAIIRLLNTIIADHRTWQNTTPSVHPR